MSPNDDLKQVRNENAYMFMRDKDGHLRRGHYVVESNTPEQKVMRWVWDERGEDSESGLRTGELHYVQSNDPGRSKIRLDPSE